MKAADFRPEHFEKGRSFSRTDFSAYVQASDKLARTAYTRYLPSVAAGLILGLLFSNVVGGFGGNILALVCIFAGLIVGAVFNVKAGRTVNALAQRLGITKADVASARKHVKNGTFAWTGGEAAFCGEEPGREAAPVKAETAAVPALQEDPRRAVWAALALTAGWLLLAVFQLRAGPRLGFSSTAFLCLASAILGTGVYLLVRSGLRWKLLGGGAGLVSSLLLASSIIVKSRVKMFARGFGLASLFPFREPLFVRNLGNALLAVFLCLGATLLFSVLRKENGKKQVLLCAVVADAVYLAAWLLPRFRMLRTMLSNLSYMAGQSLFQEVLSVFATMLTVIFACMAVSALCRMPQTRVRLRGVGLVWAWLALAGAVFTVVLVLRVGALGPRTAGVTELSAYQLILGLSALIGYALLLFKKRVGLYFILLGAGLMLGVQLLDALSNLVGAGRGANYGLRLLLSTLLGALNPFFGWLAVRAGKTPDAEA